MTVGDSSQIGLDAFLDYASKGLPVFPVWGVRPYGVCSCGGCESARDAGKHPCGPLAPNGLRDATCNPDQIRAWVQRAAANGWLLNVGVAVPPGVAVVDIDPRNGGSATWAALEQQHGAFPDTSVVETGGGGWHLWIVLPDATFRLPSKLGPGVDIRQSGGFVVAPPSVHASGKQYRWINRSARFASAPSWVEARGYRVSAEETAAAAELGEGRYEPPSVAPESHAALAAVLAPYCVDGQKHALAKALGGWLRQRGWTTGDVVETLRQMPFNDPEKRIAGALACHIAGRSNGWEELRGIVGAEVADWIDAGTRNTIREELDQQRAADSDWWLANVAPHLTVRPTDVTATLPPANPDDPLLGLPVMAPDEALRPLERIVEGLDIVAGFSTALIGRPYTAKTPLAIVLALCVANGLPFVGRATKRRPVVYLTAEKPFGADRKRVRAAKALSVDPRSVALVNTTQLPVNNAGVRERLAQVAARLPGALFILDTYGAAVQGVKHNTEEFGEPLKALNNALTAAGAAVLVILHAKKGEDVPGLLDAEGHMSVAGAVDAGLVSHRQDPDDPNTLQIQCVRAIDREHPSFLVVFSDPVIDGFAEPGLALAAVNPSVGDAIAGAAESADLTRKQLSDKQNEGKLLAIMAGQTAAISYDVLRQSVPNARQYLLDLQRAGRITLAKQGPEEYYSLKEKPLHVASPLA